MWHWTAVAAGAPLALGYVPCSQAACVDDTALIQVTLSDTNQWDMLQVGDEFTFGDGDYDFTATGTVFTVAYSVGAYVMFTKPSRKTVVTTSPTYLLARVPFRRMTLYPFRTRTTVNNAPVYMGPSATAGANWFPVDPSYTTGTLYNAVDGAMMRLSSLYGEIGSLGDRLYALFH